MAEESRPDWSREDSKQVSGQRPKSPSTTSARPDLSFCDSGPLPSPRDRALSHPSNADSTSIESFIRTLQRSRLYGPITLIDYPVKIGQGGQFYVYRQEAGFPYRHEFRSFVTAVKRPIFPERKERLELADKHLRRNLHHAHMEIKALTHEKLKDHPSIVKLLAWSVDSQGWRNPLGLVFELASADLARFLQQAGDGLSCLTKTMLSEDVARGLDAIHEAGFIHGDLKPENVLLFWENDRPVGKLSDFGFATEEGGTSMGGTAAWKPPERDPSKEGDRFAYGLFLWRVFLHSGTAPEAPAGTAILKCASEDLVKYSSALGDSISELLRLAFERLLKTDPKERPLRLSGLLQSAITHLKREPTSELQERVERPYMFRFGAPLFTWEVPGLPRILLNSLYRRFLDSRPESSAELLPSDLFAMALAFSYQLPEDANPKECVFSLLEASALRGSRPAQALIPRAAAYFRRSISPNTLKDYLMPGVMSGSTYARLDLHGHDALALESSLRTFHRQGGYILMYWDLSSPPPEPTDPPSPQQRMIRYSTIHWLAAFGNIEGLQLYLETQGTTDINSMTAKQETPLYLACARGSWPHAAILLRCGADPRTRCTPFSISCLHWLLAFETSLQQQVMQGLIQRGADINALVAAEVPFFHNPFKLPAGSPLHWAVATRSHNAVRVLIEQGADVLLRNGSDPYMYDDRIRWLYALTGPDEEGAAFREAGGLSPLDLASMQRDPCAFRAVQDFRDVATIDVNNADEEGFTVLHRLSHEQVFRTSTQVKFSPLPFRSYQENADLRTTISLIKRLGGDIDALTSSAVSEEVKKSGKPQDVPSYTPLMLAMLQTDYELVEALIDFGADVNVENIRGETALHSLSHRAAFLGKPCLGCVQLLVSHGVDVNHQDFQGRCALSCAATHRMLDVVEFLLSKGADVDTRDPVNANSYRVNLSVFGLLAHRTTDSKYEETVLRLLRQYLFGCADEEKKRRAIDLGNERGVTLLHVFAASVMPSCVKALLENGAPVNALSSHTRMVHPTVAGGQRKIWNETPLDATQDMREFHEQHFFKYKNQSAEDFGVMQEKTELVISLLQAHGGISVRKDVKDEVIRNG